MANGGGDGTSKFDIPNILNKNSQQFWNDVKIKFISKEKQDGLEMLEDIYSKFILHLRKHHSKFSKPLDCYVRRLSVIV